MKINLYESGLNSLPIQVGERSRKWMSAHSYRCLPMVAANEYGWDVETTEDVEVEWNGIEGNENLKVLQGNNIAVSKFGCGTFTFTVGYTWHTEPNVQLQVRPVPNADWLGFLTLDALIETDVLKYPWFATLRLPFASKVFIPKGTRIARVIPVRVSDVLSTELAIMEEPADFRSSKEAFTDVREKSMAKDENWTKQYHSMVKHTKIKTPPVVMGPKALRHSEGLDFLAKNGILCIPDFLTQDECAELIAVTRRKEPRKAYANPQWHERTYDLYKDDIVPKLHEKIRNGVESVIADHFGKNLRQHDQHLVKWPVGMSMLPHSDYAGDRFPHRDYAAVIYLNSDYEGGEVFIPSIGPKGMKIVTASGTLMAFHGGKLFHGVKAITKGERFTCISWLQDMNKNRQTKKTSIAENVAL